MGPIRNMKAFQAAQLAATWSKDRSTQVGAALYDPWRGATLAQGFNGFAHGVDDQDPAWHERPLKYRVTVHAETNVILHAAQYGTPTRGLGIACTFHPCALCASAIANAGISEVLCPLPDLNHPRWGEDFILAQYIFKVNKIATHYIQEEHYAIAKS